MVSTPTVVTAISPLKCLRSLLPGCLDLWYTAVGSAYAYVLRQSAQKSFYITSTHVRLINFEDFIHFVIICINPVFLI